MTSGINPCRPVYTGLQPDSSAKAHIILAEAEGAYAVVDLFAKAEAAFAKGATILYVAASPDDQELLHKLDQLGAIVLRFLPDVTSLLQYLAHLMEAATMDTRIYVSGSIGFIGKAAQSAACYGIGFESLRTELRGSSARRVQCVHCKAVEEQVLHDVVICSRCRVKLTVREHYSHRLNAFMGVSRDAEELVTRTPISDPAP